MTGRVLLAVHGHQSSPWLFLAFMAGVLVVAGVLWALPFVLPARRAVPVTARHRKQPKPAQPPVVVSGPATPPVPVEPEAVPSAGAVPPEVEAPANLPDDATTYIAPWRYRENWFKPGQHNGGAK